MASSSRDKRGNAIIQFIGIDKKRRSIRVGKLSDISVESIRVRVELLAVARKFNEQLDTETAQWLANTSAILRAKLFDVGLVGQRRGPKITEVYFVLDPLSREVKIGKSDNFKKRLAGMITSNPRLKLIGIVSGVEDEYHKRFAVYRADGEFFRIEGELLTFLEKQFPGSELLKQYQSMSVVNPHENENHKDAGPDTAHALDAERSRAGFAHLSPPSLGVDCSWGNHLQKNRQVSTLPPF